MTLLMQIGCYNCIMFYLRRSPSVRGCTFIEEEVWPKAYRTGSGKLHGVFNFMYRYLRRLEANYIWFSMPL